MVLTGLTQIVVSLGEFLYSMLTLLLICLQEWAFLKNPATRAVLLTAALVSLWQHNAWIFVWVFLTCNGALLYAKMRFLAT